MNIKKWKSNKILINIILFIIGLGVCFAFEDLGLIKSSIILVIEYIGIYIIFVIGVNLINGYLGIFSLAHAGVMAIGAYSSALASMYLFNSSLTFPISILIGGTMGMLAGMLLAISSFKVSGDYLAIITLGFSLIIKSILQNMEFVGGSRGLRPIPKYTTLLYIYVCVILAIIIVTKFIKSKFGRSILAIRDDPVAAELVSVNIRKSKIVAFGLSSFLIGVSGSLVAHLIAYTNPASYGYTSIVDGLVMVYLGGVGSITGSIIGATVWQILVQSLRGIGIWRWVIGGGILVIVMIFLPNGIYGNRELTWKDVKNLPGAVKGKIASIKAGGAAGTDKKQKGDK